MLIEQVFCYILNCGDFVITSSNAIFYIFTFYQFSGVSIVINKIAIKIVWLGGLLGVCFFCHVSGVALAC